MKAKRLRPDPLLARAIEGRLEIEMDNLHDNLQPKLTHKETHALCTEMLELQQHYKSLTGNYYDPTTHRPTDEYGV